MNAKIPVFVICVEGIIYLLLYNLHDCTFKKLFPEAATRGFLLKKVLLKISQNSQENTCVGVFYNKVLDLRPAAQKETLAQVFSCEFYEIFKNIFLTDQLQVTAFVFLQYFHVDRSKISDFGLEYIERRIQKASISCFYSIILFFVFFVFFSRGL